MPLNDLMIVTYMALLKGMTCSLLTHLAYVNLSFGKSCLCTGITFYLPHSYRSSQPIIIKHLTKIFNAKIQIKNRIKEDKTWKKVKIKENKIEK